MTFVQTSEFRQNSEVWKFPFRVLRVPNAFRIPIRCPGDKSPGYKRNHPLKWVPAPSRIYPAATHVARRFISGAAQPIPAPTFQPQRGFHALSEGFIPNGSWSGARRGALYFTWSGVVTWITYDESTFSSKTMARLCAGSMNVSFLPIS